jgi:hypothetical protein
MKSLFKDSSTQVRINGQTKTIKIRNVEIFPAAAGAFYAQTDCKDALVIDVGGLSIDTALFVNKKLQKYSTYSMGVMKLYSKIANRLNGEYDLSLTEWDIETVLRDGLYIFGSKVDLKVGDIIAEHISDIMARLSLEYDLKSIRNVLLTGGASNFLFEFISIPQLKLMENSQFSNAIGYKNIGKVLFT